MKKMVLISIMLLFGSVAFAANISKPLRSVDALGMGDAYYTKSDSKFAPFYNPAGLARVEERLIDIVPLALDSNRTGMHLYSEMSDTNTGDPDEAVGVARVLFNYMDKPLSIAADAYASYTRQNFSIGFYEQMHSHAVVPSVDTSSIDFATPSTLDLLSLEMTYLTEYGVVFGVADSLFRNKLQLGIAPRYVTRKISEHEYSHIELNENDFDIFRHRGEKEEATLMIVDAGFIYNFTTGGLNPRFGGALNNLTAIEIGDDVSTDHFISASLGISPSYGAVKSDLIIDVIDITHNVDSELDWGKRINAGAEFRIHEHAIVRVGRHLGYMTFGIGLEIPYLRISYAHYYEDIEAAGAMVKDERHAIEFILGF